MDPSIDISTKILQIAHVYWKYACNRYRRNLITCIPGVEEMPLLDLIDVYLWNVVNPDKYSEIYAV